VVSKGLEIVPERYLNPKVKPTIIKNIYILALLLRLFLEYRFIKLEMDLAEHQSGKSGLLERFFLPEKYICETNYYTDTEIVSQAWKDTSRFKISEQLEACNKQPFAIPCWIVASRIKTLGILWMFFVQIVSTILTIVEIIWEVFRVCCCNKSKTS
jgi:hypothetical protein